VKITVKTPFRLNVDGEIKQFDAGVHDVEKNVAEHWYVQAHLAGGDAVADEPAAETEAEQGAEETQEPEAEQAATGKKKGK
jgi:hypothetical protein